MLLLSGALPALSGCSTDTRSKGQKSSPGAKADGKELSVAIDQATPTHSSHFLTTVVQEVASPTESWSENL